MYFFGYFFQALALVIHYGLTFFMWVIIARAVLSWVSPDPFNPIVRFINNMTEPLLYQVRRRLPVVYSGIDLSPILIIFGIVFLRSFLVNSLHRLAMGLL